MKQKFKKLTIGELYHKGWVNKSPVAEEFYSNIINDLAEDINNRRITKNNLIEVCGYLVKAQLEEINKRNALRDGVFRVLTEIM